MKLRCNLMLLFAALFSLCSLSSCADLGAEFKTEEDYGNAYNVNLFNSSRSKLYSDPVPITDFYNKDTVNKFACPIEEDNYRYLIIQPTEDQEIDEMYFYINSSVGGTMLSRFFIVDRLPSRLSNLDEALTKFNEFLSSGEDEFTFDYGDEPSSKPYASTSTTMRAGKWTDVGFTRFHDEEGNQVKKLSVTTDQYIFIQFYNNCDTGITFKKGMTFEEAKEAVKKRKEEHLPIRVTDIMIHTL